jgi:hypothetical protein
VLAAEWAAIAVVTRDDVLALRLTLLCGHLRPRTPLWVTLFDRTLIHRVHQEVPSVNATGVCLCTRDRIGGPEAVEAGQAALPREAGEERADVLEVGRRCGQQPQRRAVTQQHVPDQRCRPRRRGHRHGCRPPFGADGTPRPAAPSGPGGAAAGDPCVGASTRARDRGNLARVGERLGVCTRSEVVILGRRRDGSSAVESVTGDAGRPLRLGMRSPAVGRATGTPPPASRSRAGPRRAPSRAAAAEPSQHAAGRLRPDGGRPNARPRCCQGPLSRKREAERRAAVAITQRTRFKADTTPA